MYSKRQGIQDAQSAIQEYDNQINDLKKEKSETNKKSLLICGQIEETTSQLASGLLDNIKLENIAAVAKEIGAIHLITEFNLQHFKLENNKSKLSNLLSHKFHTEHENLMHPVAGTLTKSLKENIELLDSIKESISKLESSPHFKWVVNNIQEPKTFWGRVANVFSSGFFNSKKRFAECQKEVGDLKTAVNQYHELIKHKVNAKKSLEDVKKSIDDVNKHTKIINITEGCISDFDKNTLDILHSTISSHISGCELKAIIPTIRDDAKVLVSKIDALKNKSKHLDDILSHISSEISDRQDRLQKIRTVLSKWKRSKKSYLSGDKSKWLIDTPKGCKKRTSRFIGSYSSTRSSICDYDDYFAYSAAFCTGLVFSSFLIFQLSDVVDSYVTNEVFSELDELSNFDGDMLSDSDLMSMSSEGVDMEALTEDNSSEESLEMVDDS